MSKDQYPVEDWGLIDYQKALALQESFASLVSEQNIPGKIVLCSHPEVVTLGRATKPDDVFGFQGPVIEISRGGRATYHGPSQLVVYPIVNLGLARAFRPVNDIGAYLRNFETAIVNTLKEFGIESQGRSLQKKSGEEVPAEETGVWVGRRKIASLGIAIRKWVSFHGAALNVDQDAKAFQGLKPCGFTPDTMISMEEVLGHKVDRSRLNPVLLKNLQELL